WCNGEYKRGKAKVAWEDICLPIREGGWDYDVLRLVMVLIRLYGLIIGAFKVWRIVRTFAGMDRVPPRIDDIVDRLHPMAAKRTFKSIVGKLILAATAYFIWSKRNNRLFKNVRRSPEELNDLIMVVTLWSVVVSCCFVVAMWLSHMLWMFKLLLEGVKLEDKVTLYLTQVFNVNNWALKPNQPEESPFTYHMLAICAIDKPVVFKAPKTSSKAKSVSQGTKPGAQTGQKKPLPSLKQPTVSSKEETKGEKILARPWTQTKANLQFLHQWILECIKRTSKQLQQGMDEETKNTSYDHIFAGKRASSITRQVEEEEASSTIKLEDLVKLVSNIEPSFKDLDSPEDDHVITVDDNDEDEIHVAINDETKDTSVPKSLSHSLPTELKDLPSKFNELTKEVKGLKKQVHELEIELPGDLKEIPTKLTNFTKTILNSASSKVKDHSVLSPGQADTRPTEGDKDTNQATISQLFLRRANKNAKKDNLNKNKPQTETTPPPNPLVITTTITQMQSPSLQPPLKSSAQLKGEHIKEHIKESTNSYSDDETHVTGSMVEPSRTKKLKKFDFITEDRRHVHLTKEEVNHQKKLEEDAKAKAAKQEREVRKAKLVDLLGLEAVKKYYNEKLSYDKYYDKMLNRRVVSRITNYDVLTRKGLYNTSNL
nr:reverse transcriptase domain, reverse transcriptase zinc-binding domain protein [Tanacetum cinerariifolium]